MRISGSGELRAGGALALAALVFVLTGCGAAAPTNETGSPAAETTQTATPTPSATTTRPVAAFGGDCSAAVTEDELAPLVGPVRLRPEWAQPSPSDKNLGVLECYWTSDSARVDLVVMPAAAVTASSAAGRVLDCADSIPTCSVSVSSAGLWFSVDAGHPARGTGDAPGALANAILDLVIPRAQQYPPAVMAQSGPGWWRLPACDDLDRSLDMAALMQVATVTAGIPSDNVPQGIVWDALVSNGLDQWCAWTGWPGAAYDTANGSSRVTVNIWPGGAQAGVPRGFESDVDRRAVAGADYGLSAPNGQLYVAAGPNALEVSAPDSATAARVAEALLPLLHPRSS